MSTSVTSTKLAESVQSCRVLLSQSLEVCQSLMDPGSWLAHTPSNLYLSCQVLQSLPGSLNLKPLWPGSVKCCSLLSNIPVLRPEFFSFSSAVMGHRLHRVCGYHPGVSVLLLRLQKMDIQEEKQEEGQRQGQKRHQHEGRH